MFLVIKLPLKNKHGTRHGRMYVLAIFYFLYTSRPGSGGRYNALLVLISPIHRGTLKARQPLHASQGVCGGEYFVFLERGEPVFKRVEDLVQHELVQEARVASGMATEAGMQAHEER